jgi:hypothetical protein
VSTFDMLDGLLAGITREDIDRMPPVRRQRFTQALRRAIDMLERPHAKPRQEVQDGRARLHMRHGPRERSTATGHGWAGLNSQSGPGHERPGQHLSIMPSEQWVGNLAISSVYDSIINDR